MPDGFYSSLPLPKPVPRAFLFRRLHSLAELFFILFVCGQILTSAEVTRAISAQSAGLAPSTNLFQSLPHRSLTTLILLAIPIAIYAWLGIRYSLEAQFNSFPSDGSTPSLTRYPRNHAFTWHRIITPLLILGVIAHVVFMRSVYHPHEIDSTPHATFAVPVTADPRLLTLAPRLKAVLITPESQPQVLGLLQRHIAMVDHRLNSTTVPSMVAAEELQRVRLQTTHTYIAGLRPTPTQWTAICEDMNAASLLSVREHFRSLWVCILYTLFVLAAAFHAANGLWNFAISWGLTLNYGSRCIVHNIGMVLGIAIVARGLTSIWQTYWNTL